MALDFVAGCFGGIAGVVVGHPLDTIKVHLQVQDPKCQLYRGTWHCFNTIVKKESVRGLFKGMTSPLGGVAFINAITFGTYGNVLRRLPADWNPTVGVFIAGSTAGVVQSVVASPIELAKSRMQLETAKAGTTHQCGGPLKCLAAVRRSDGWRRGVFRGLTVTALRDAPGFGLYFATYELVCGFLTSACGEALAGPFSVILAGGIGGTVSWVLTYPLDVVKTRVQTDVGIQRRYTSAIHCFIESYRREGATTFSRGMNSTILRAFPTNAATFLAVSFTFRLLGHRFQQPEVMTSSTSTSTSPGAGHCGAAVVGSGRGGGGGGGGGGGVESVGGSPNRGGGHVSVITDDTAIKWRPPLVLQQSTDENTAVGELGWLAAHANYW